MSVASDMMHSGCESKRILPDLRLSTSEQYTSISAGIGIVQHTLAKYWRARQSSKAVMVSAYSQQVIVTEVTFGLVLAANGSQGLLFLLQLIFFMVFLDD